MVKAKTPWGVLYSDYTGAPRATRLYTTSVGQSSSALGLSINSGLVSLGMSSWGEWYECMSGSLPMVYAMPSTGKSSRLLMAQIGPRTSGNYMRSYVVCPEPSLL